MNEITVADLIRQATALEMNAEAMLLHARVFRAQVVAVLAGASSPEEDERAGVAQDRAPAPLKPEGGQGSAAPPASEPIECKCPPNRRVVAPAEGHATRTKCRLCQRMHE